MAEQTATERFTLLNLLADRCTVAQTNANKRRDACKTRQEAQHVDQKSYLMGQSAAFNEARQMVDAELRRLRNRLQNGCLTIDDFGAEW